MTDDIKAIRDALAAGDPNYFDWLGVATPERIARLLDALEAAQNDAERWRWLVRHASLGFDAAPSWNAVVRLPVLDADDQHIAAIVDRAMKEAP